MPLRLCKLPKLLYYFNRSACSLYCCLGFFTYSIHFESEFTFQFAIAQYFYFIILANQAVCIKTFSRKFFNTIRISQLRQLTNIKNFVFYAVRIVESAFRDTTLNGHLAAFMRHLSFV